MSAVPLVSICVPTYNSAAWIRESVGSALAQTYAPVEVLVVDNASTDGTLEILRDLGDPRIRVERNSENVGAVRNFNRCIDLAQGKYVKFLMSDDLLFPDCVRRMLELFEAEATIGMVFSPREILLDADAGAQDARWKEQAGEPHLTFDRLETINSGRDLFEQYLAAALKGNRIGEPTNVMVRRECFARVGGFNPRLCQEVDYAMWLRLMYFYDVGFVDEKLSAFRLHGGATTASNKRLNRDWLDHLWLLEDLLSYPEIRRDYPELRRLRSAELYRLVRAEIGRVVKAPFGVRRPTLPFPTKMRACLQYLDHRVHRRDMSRT